jgi:hypothetical protein
MAKTKTADMTIEQMKAAIAKSEGTAAEVNTMFDAIGQAVDNAPLPASTGGAGFSLPTDLDGLWDNAVEKKVVSDTVSTSVKFSIVGNRSKAVNVYFSKNEKGVNGLRVVVGIIRASGLKFEAIEKTTMSKWENGKATEVPCEPYRFLKLSASANSLSGAQLLVKLAAQVQASGVDWS